MSYNQNTWNNGDGLHLKFDTDQAEMINLGSYQGSDGRWVTEADVELSRLVAGANFLSYNFKVKEGAYIHSAHLAVPVAAAGGTSIEVGLYDTEGATAIDADGFITTTATAAMTADAYITGNEGALVGDTASDNGLIVVTSVGTFTAGRVKVRLVWEVL